MFNSVNVKAKLWGQRAVGSMIQRVITNEHLTGA